MNKLATKEFLYNQYIVNKKRPKEIGKMIGLSEGRVQALIHKFDIPRLPRHHDLTGKKFGKLTVKEFSHYNQFRTACWKCVCDCGKQTIVRALNLKCGDTQSCGCRAIKRFGLISGTYFCGVKHNAIKRNLEFNITIEQAWDIYQKQKGICAISGVPISLYLSYKDDSLTTASIDRIDSSKGYTLDNIQWVHKSINRLKGSLSDTELLKWVDTIYTFQHRK